MATIPHVVSAAFCPHCTPLVAICHPFFHRRFHTGQYITTTDSHHQLHHHRHYRQSNQPPQLPVLKIKLSVLQCVLMALIPPDYSLKEHSLPRRFT